MLTVLGWFLMSWVVCVTAVVNRPPMITAEPPYNVFYKPKETVELQCEGNGVPMPTFSWIRNGQDFNPSGNDQRVVQLSKRGKGTLVFNSPEDKDEGVFQCIASNDFGVATSIKVNMRVAIIKMFATAPPIIHEPTLGMGFSLPCIPPESVPPAQVFWTYKDELGGFEALSYSKRITMDREFTLHFAHIKREDENNGQPYACMAVNNIMRNNSLGPPHYIKVKGNTAGNQPVAVAWSDSDDRFGLKGKSLSIKCIFSGKEEPDVVWERTGNKTIDYSRVRLESFSQELLINDLQYEDAGQYECMGSNSENNIVTRTFNIRVNSAPSFLERPKSVETEEDATVRFHCRAEGVPEPIIRWFVNGVSLRASRDPRLTPDRFKTIGGDTIQLERVQLTDFMVFQCNASNIHGYVFANAFLNVLSEAPVIIEPPETMKISAEGIPINITCRTSGKPTPIITWFKDGTQVTGGRYQVLSTGDLHINQLVLADAGHYVCEARNKHNVTDANGGLVVRRKTRIEQKPGDLERNAGMDAKFTCSGTTDPEEVTKLRILWLKDGKQISGSDERMMTNFQDNSLTISGTITRDTGTYTCVATNGLDSATASAVLTVKDRPDAPTQVLGRECTDTVIIEWMPGSYNNAPIQYYVLQYNTAFNPNQWNFGMKVNATVHQVLMPLSPWVTYTFRIIAYNKIGPSNPSEPTKECTTEAKSPTYNPRNLRTLGNHPNTLYIEWTPIPEIHYNGPGFVYKLEIVLTGQSETDKEIKTIDKLPQNYLEMTTGKVYERYNITIRAENSKGSASGDPTKIVGRSYEAKPSISPSAFTALKVDDTKVQFMWEFDIKEITMVTGSRIRGEFRGFKIQFWQENNPGLTIREADIGPEIALNKTTNTFNATVSDMLPNTRMEARISVMNNFYVGPPTEPIRFYTKPGYPGPVDYLRILNIGDTHVNLEWGAPEETRGDLVGYDISYQLVDGLDLSEMQDREPQINDPFATNAYLSGLEPNKRYRVHIFARTQKGRGEGYFIELVTAKPGTPRMPRFKVVDVGQHFINITWWVNAYYSSGSVVFVEYRKIDGAEWIRTSDEVVNTWKNISNLEAGTSYEVRIKATNGARSVSSSIAEVTTDGTAIASALVGNIGWFLGMLFSILVLIGLIILFVLCYRNGFRLQMFDGPSFGNNTSGAYSGTYDNTARMDQSSDKFGPEPKGYNNDYYDDKDYMDGDYHHEPPGYNGSSAHSGEKAPIPGDYEDFNRKPSRDYDDDYDHRQPSAPSNDGYYRDHGQGNQDGYYDRGGDDGYYDRRNDDYYDRRDDDYYGRDGAGNDHYDRRDDDYDRRDYYDHRDNNGSNDRQDYDDYDRDKRDYGRDSGRQGYDYDSDEPPRRASSSQGGGDGGHSSTVV